MEKSKFVSVLLGVSGVIGIGIGAALLFAPVAFEASAGIIVGSDVNLLSELRAPGGLLLAGGIVIMLGAFKSKLTYSSLLLSSLMYLSYGVSRIWSILMDGMPGESLVIATVLELIIGVISVLMLVRYKKEA